MECDILDDFLLLMDVALGDRNVLLSLEIEFRRIRIRPSNSLIHVSSTPVGDGIWGNLDGTGIRLNINHIPNHNLLFLNTLINTRIQL